MVKKVGISFKEDEEKIYNFLRLKSKIIGPSAYIKILIEKDMEKEHEKSLSKEG